jgi:Na+/H+-dicarboxylate symporter
MVLTTVGIPAEGIALIMGVDRILDMSRTAVNVAGDIVAARLMDGWVGSGSEGISLTPRTGAAGEAADPHGFEDAS